MGSKTTVKEVSNGTQTVAPPSWTMPGIQETSNRVLGALDQIKGLQPYQGNFVAQPNMQLLNNAIGGYTGAAAAAPGGAMLVQDAITNLGGVKPVTTGRYDVGGPYDLQPAIEAATRPIFRDLTERALPGMRSSALESGAYTGDRMMSVAPQQIISQALRDAQDTAATIGLEDYSQREARRLAGWQSDEQNALSAGQFNNNFELDRTRLLPDLIDQRMKLLASVGDLNGAALGLDLQGKQAGIDNATAANDYAVKYPFQGLDIASALLAQLSGNYGTTTSQGTNTRTQSTGGLGNVLQGVLGATGLIGSLPVSGGGSLLGNLFKKGG